MGRRHGDDIRRYYLDAFGFDGTIEESSRRLVEIFEGLGIPMYFDAKVTRDEILSIPCDTELGKDEICSLIESLTRP